MSVSSLFTPNPLTLYAGTLNAREFLVDKIEAASAVLTGDLTVDGDTILDGLTSGASNISSLVSNTITTTGGNNYLSPWDASKNYIVGDLVGSSVSGSAQLYKCLLPNIGIAPTTSPSQAQWVRVSSNNTFNNPNFIQVNGVYGDDIKALTAPIAFKTIQAGLNYLATVGGGTCRITSSSTNYTENLSMVGSTFNNIVLDGGDNGSFTVGGNTIIGNLTLSGCTNITFRNVTLYSGAGSTAIATITSNNFTFENVVFRTDNTVVGNEVTFTSCNFINVIGCRNYSNTASPLIQFAISGTWTANSTIYFFDWNNEIFQNITAGASFTIDTSALTNVDTNYVINSCSVNLASSSCHTNGRLIIFNSRITSDFVDTCGSGGNNGLIVANTSMYNTVTSSYYTFTKSGGCNYRFRNFDFNQNTSITGTGTNISAGPATFFNQNANINVGIATSLVADTATALNLGGIGTNTYSIISVSGNTITFNNVGVYNLIVTLKVASCDLVTIGQSVSMWIGVSGSDETTANYRASFSRPNVSNVLTYPTTYVDILLNCIVAAGDSYIIYCRNLGTTTFNVTSSLVRVLQLR